MCLDPMQVVDAPEILTAIGQTPYLKEYLTALYGCQYGEFFKVSSQGGLRVRVRAQG